MPKCPQCGKFIGYQQDFCSESCGDAYFASPECVFNNDDFDEELDFEEELEETHVYAIE